jgi:SH3 domain-containing YSC84-like protein 1
MHNTKNQAFCGVTFSLAAMGVLLVSGMLQTPAYADTANERLQESAEVLRDVMAAPDKGIPRDLIEKAYCVVVIPNEKKAAFIVGAKYGRGYAVCRKDDHSDWGAPAAVRVEGGSFGFQIGGAETDLVMLIMNEDGMRHLMQDKFTLGGDASAVAGPVGRSVSADTDAELHSKILTYSRSRGVFGGISLNGATLRNDVDTNRDLYGKSLHNNEILLHRVTPPAAARPLLSELHEYSERQPG